MLVDMSERAPAALPQRCAHHGRWRNTAPKLLNFFGIIAVPRVGDRKIVIQAVHRKRVVCRCVAFKNIQLQARPDFVGQAGVTSAPYFNLLGLDSIPVPTGSIGTDPQLKVTAFRGFIDTCVFEDNVARPNACDGVEAI